MAINVVGCLRHNGRYQELQFSWILFMKNEFEATCLRLLSPVVMQTQLPCRYQVCNMAGWSQSYASAQAHRNVTIGGAIETCKD